MISNHIIRRFPATYRRWFRQSLIKNQTLPVNCFSSNAELHHHKLTFCSIATQNRPRLDIDNLSKCSSIRCQDFEELIRDLEVNKRLLENSANVLGLCRKLHDVSADKRVSLAVDLLHKFRNLSVNIREEHYLGLLQCYLESKKFKDLGSFLSEMKLDNVEPSIDIQLLILKCMAECGKYEEVKEMAQMLKQQGSEDELLGSVILSLVTSGYADKASSEFKMLKNNNITIGSHIYTAMLRCCMANGNANEMNDLCEKIHSSEVKFSNQQISSILETVALDKNYSLMEVAKIVSSEQIAEVAPDVLMKLIHCNEIDCAVSLLKNLILCVQFPEDYKKTSFCNRIYKLLVKELIEKNYEPYRLFDLCKDLRNVEGCLYAVEYALYNYLQAKRFKTSLQFLKKMIDNDIAIEAHYFSPIIIAASKEFGPEGVSYLFHQMMDINVIPDGEFLNTVIFPAYDKCTKREYMTILKGIKLPILQAFIQEKFILYTLKKGYFLKCLDCVELYGRVKYKNLEELQRACISALNDFEINKHILTLMRIMNVDLAECAKELVINNKLDKLRFILKIAKGCEMIAKDSKIVNSLLERSDVPDDIKEDIKKLTPGNDVGTRSKIQEQDRNDADYVFQEIEKAEINLLELKYKDMKITTQLFMLLKLYMKAKLLDKAIKIKNELQELFGEDLNLSRQFLVNFCMLAVYEDNVDEALKFYRLVKSKHPDFDLDIAKLLKLVQLLFKHQKIDEALHLLADMPNNYLDPAMIESKTCMIFDIVSKYGDLELTKKVFDILKKKRVIELTGFSLSVTINTAMCMKDYDKAFELYESEERHGKVLSVTIELLKQFALANRWDLFDKIVEKRKHIPIKTDWFIRSIAEAGDVKSLCDYIKKLDISVNTKYFHKLMASENITLVGLKSMIACCAELNINDRPVVEKALKLLVNKKNKNEIMDFLAFMNENNYRLLDADKKLLCNTISLCEIFTIFEEQHLGNLSRNVIGI